MNYIRNRRHVPGARYKQVKRVERLAPFFKLSDDDTIYARLNKKTEFEYKIPRPEDRRELVLREHELGHPKAEKIEEALRAKKIYWKNMRKYIDEFDRLVRYMH